MHNALVVIDMQNDFITGSLGTEEAQKIVPKVCEKIRNWEGTIIVTQDTHDIFYRQTQEGKRLPVTHCLIEEYGWKLHNDVKKELSKKDHVEYFRKRSFGSYYVGDYFRMCDFDYIEIIGLCTDVCVISNAMIIKAAADTETIVAVDSTCCAGSTQEKHLDALKAMRNCQIDII